MHKRVLSNVYSLAQALFYHWMIYILRAVLDVLEGAGGGYKAWIEYWSCLYFTGFLNCTRKYDKYDCRGYTTALTRSTMITSKSKDQASKSVQKRKSFATEPRPDLFSTPDEYYNIDDKMINRTRTLSISNMESRRRPNKIEGESVSRNRRLSHGEQRRHTYIIHQSYLNNQTSLQIFHVDS